MADPLLTPWWHVAVDPVPPSPRVSFACLAAPAGRAEVHVSSGDLLLCPWSGTVMTPPLLRGVTSLPTSAPRMPVQRTTAVEALEPA